MLETASGCALAVSRAVASSHFTLAFSCADVVQFFSSVIHGKGTVSFHEIASTILSPDPRREAGMDSNITARRRKVMTHRSMVLANLLSAVLVLLTVAMIGPSAQAGGKKEPSQPSPTGPIPPPLPDSKLPPMPTDKGTLNPFEVPPVEVNQKVPSPLPFAKRYTFKFDPKTPIASLLPTPPKTVSKLPSLFNEDLRKVPVIAFGEPLSNKLSKEKALRGTAHILAKVNHLNEKKKDGFMLAMIAQRTDLQGLPFLMGEECRTCEKQAKFFALIANATNRLIGAAKQKDDGIQIEEVEVCLAILKELNASSMLRAAEDSKFRVAAAEREGFYRASIAALMQILAPESEGFRAALARYLATVPHVDATRALAKLALFSPEEEVRSAAIEGLKLRREKDYTDILLQGFRYPLPMVSKNAAEALVKLERKDLVANLVAVLEEADPRLPSTKTVNGKEVSVVRELVRVNHNRSCLLCHAPGNTANLPDGILTVAVPLPSEPLPKPSEGGYNSTPPETPDILVRIDMTYLRQDFSLMMPVADAEPWPDRSATTYARTKKANCRRIIGPPSSPCAN
jgi:hypothetical protein